MTDLSDFPKRLRLSLDGQKRVLAIAKQRAREYKGREDRYKAYLEEQADVHRHTVARFLDERKVCNFDTVEKICVALDLDWQEVCDLESVVHERDRPTPALASVDALVQTTRQAVAGRIRTECGTVQMSGHSIPIQQLVEPDLHAISGLPSEQFRLPALLTQEVDEESFDRMGIIPAYGSRVDGRALLKELRRLLVYASPGCGKTSYLKWIATLCNEGRLLPDCVPIFIGIRAFAIQSSHKDLYTFVGDYLTGCGVRTAQDTIRTLFQAGRILLLLDGLDEVPRESRKNVDQHIADMLHQSFSSYYACSCRLGLTLRNTDNFQKAMIAPFSPRQRALYAQRWFKANQTDAVVERQFNDRLRRHINFGELTRTPLLLDLLCRVFQDYKMFPNTRAKVYDWGLDSLLKDDSRKTRTNSTLGHLSIEQTRALLQKIAAECFLEPQPQTLLERQSVEDKINSFFQAHLAQPAGQYPSARQMIVDIEVTYGLLIQQASHYCSFSHLTFQEYFTAEYLVKRHQESIVLDHITDLQWQFVIELVAEILPSQTISGFLLGYKQALDALVQSNGKIRRFLRWVDSMAIAAHGDVNTQKPFALTLLRAWYFASSLGNPMAMQTIGQLSQKFEFPDFDSATSTLRSPTLDLHRLFYQAYHATLTQPVASPDTDEALMGALTLATSSYRVQEASGRYDANGFIRLIQSIYQQVSHEPALENHIAGWQRIIDIQMQNHSIPQDWWHYQRTSWHKKVSTFMKSHYDLQCGWDFTEAERTTLLAYYDATKLLSVCMNRAQRLPQEHYNILADNMLLLEPISLS